MPNTHKMNKETKIGRDEAIKEIMSALERRSSKTWSVEAVGTGGILITSPPDRRWHGHLSDEDSWELFPLFALREPLLVQEKTAWSAVISKRFYDQYGNDLNSKGILLHGWPHQYEEFVDRANGRVPTVIGHPVTEDERHESKREMMERLEEFYENAMYHKTMNPLQDNDCPGDFEFFIGACDLNQESFDRMLSFRGLTLKDFEDWRGYEKVLKFLAEESFHASLTSEEARVEIQKISDGWICMGDPPPSIFPVALLERAHLTATEMDNLLHPDQDTRNNDPEQDILF
jgi:hypothetical protein